LTVSLTRVCGSPGQLNCAPCRAAACVSASCQPTSRSRSGDTRSADTRVGYTITQLEARTRAYGGARKRIYMECTVSLRRAGPGRST
jgi:hypothetical protein